MNNQQRDADHQAPYSYDNTYWVAYDDKEAVTLKVRFRLMLLSKAYHGCDIVRVLGANG